MLVFSRLLYLLNTFLLPAGNTLPTSYLKARAAINHLLVPAQGYDCCVNDCIIFRKSAERDFSDLSSCPKCKSKYSDDGPFHGDPRGISLSLCTDGQTHSQKKRLRTPCGQ